VDAVLPLRRTHRAFDIVAFPIRADSQTDLEVKLIIDRYRPDKLFIVSANCCLFTSLHFIGKEIPSLKVSYISRINGFLSLK